MKPRHGVKAEERKEQAARMATLRDPSVPDVPTYTERQLDDMALEIQRRVTAAERARGVTR